MNRAFLQPRVLQELGAAVLVVRGQSHRVAPHGLLCAADGRGCGRSLHSCGPADLACAPRRLRTFRASLGRCGRRRLGLGCRGQVDRRVILGFAGSLGDSVGCGRERGPEHGQNTQRTCLAVDLERCVPEIHPSWKTFSFRGTLARLIVRISLCIWIDGGESAK